MLVRDGRSLAVAAVGRDGNGYRASVLRASFALIREERTSRAVMKHDRQGDRYQLPPSGSARLNGGSPRNGLETGGRATPPVNVETRPKVVFFYQIQSVLGMLMRVQLTRPHPARTSWNIVDDSYADTCQGAVK